MAGHQFLPRWQQARWPRCPALRREPEPEQALLLEQALPSELVQVLPSELVQVRILAQVQPPEQTQAQKPAGALAHWPSAPLERAQSERSLRRRARQQYQGQRWAWYAWWMAPKG